MAVSPLVVAGVCVHVKTAPVEHLGTSPYVDHTPVAYGCMGEVQSDSSLCAQPAAGQGYQPTELSPTHVLDHMNKRLSGIEQNALKVDKMAWLKGLPNMQIKQADIKHTGPPAKGEQEANISTWPMEFNPDVVNLPSFWEWLGVDKNQSSLQHRRCQMVGRVIGMLEPTGPQPHNCHGLDDVRTLVAVYTTG